MTTRRLKTLSNEFLAKEWRTAKKAYSGKNLSHRESNKMLTRMINATKEMEKRKLLKKIQI